MPEYPIRVGGRSTGRAITDLSEWQEGEIQRPQTEKEGEVIEKGLQKMAEKSGQAQVVPAQIQSSGFTSAETRDYASVTIRKTTRGPSVEVKVVNQDPAQAQAQALRIWREVLEEI